MSADSIMDAKRVSRIELRPPTQLLRELPSLVARQHHRRLEHLKGLKLAGPLKGVWGAVVFAQHREVLAWRMPRERGHVSIGHAAVLEVGRKRMAEAVEADAFCEAQVLHVSAELVQQPLAVARIGLTGGSVDAGGQVGEEARVAAALDVIDEIEESGVQKRLVDRDATDGRLALEALSRPGALVPS